MPTTTTTTTDLHNRDETPSRPAESNAPNHHTNSGAIVAGVVVVVLLILFCLGLLYAYKFWRARRHGLPPPSLNPFASQSAVATRNYPARGGVVGWVRSKVKTLRNKRTAGGSYESGRNRGFGPLDQDEEGGAWDARMHHEEEEEAAGVGYGGGGGGGGGGRGYYEEQELGLMGAHAHAHARGGSYVDGSYDSMDTGYHAPRGLEPETPRVGGGHSRGLSEFDTGPGGGVHSDPFADSAERSDLGGSGVSPRPVVDTHMSDGKRPSKKGSKDGDSPTERRSIFHEDV